MQDGISFSWVHSFISGLQHRDVHLQQGRAGGTGGIAWGPEGRDVCAFLGSSGHKKRKFKAFTDLSREALSLNVS